jgi:hypothetical protein
VKYLISVKKHVAFEITKDIINGVNPYIATKDIVTYWAMYDCIEIARPDERGGFLSCVRGYAGDWFVELGDGRYCIIPAGLFRELVKCGGDMVVMKGKYTPEHRSNSSPYFPPGESDATS